MAAGGISLGCDAQLTMNITHSIEIGRCLMNDFTWTIHDCEGLRAL